MNEVVCSVHAGPGLRGCWEVRTLTDTQVWSSRNEERILDLWRVEREAEESRC